MSRTAVIAGATGLVGSHCLRHLTSGPTYGRVVALTRRPFAFQRNNLEQREVDFETLNLTDIEPAADVFCALGTTIGKAGSKEAFRTVDLFYVVKLAEQSARCGARQFSVVSSVASDASTASFYLKTKAEMEQAVSSMPFHAVHIFRPSLLVGQRQESRPVERLSAVLAKALRFALIGSLRKYQPIEADTTAAAMLAAARDARPGVHVYHYDDMQRLARGR